MYLTSYMTTIPDSFTVEELNEILDDVGNDKALYGGLTQEEVEDLALEALTWTFERCPDPIIHKVIALSIIKRFAIWSQTSGEEIIEQAGSSEISSAWIRDAGILAASHQLLSSISISEDDFTSPEE